MGDKLGGARLHWNGHLKGQEEGYVGRRTLEMAVPGRMKSGEPKRRSLDLVREDTIKVGAVEGEVDRVKWRRMTARRESCGDPE